MTPKEILRKYWGYDSFRPLQEEIVASVLDGHDTLGMLPTGGGKSITFQVPGIALGGLTLVVTPLISLMKDQADHLLERGIKAAAVYMGMTRDEIAATYNKVINEHYHFLYLSPERLHTQMFQAKLPYLNIRLLVVDEAHCISQWGYDFRPPYQRIAEFRKLLAETCPETDPVPCMALTATATPTVIKDICRFLQFRKDYRIFQASFVRPNLTYTVIRTSNLFDVLTQLLSQDRSSIVYVRSRTKTQRVAEALTGAGIPATFYHAGLSAQQKQERQDAWMHGEVPVMCATNAFGMGIDKPDVRTVIHLDLPPSPEEYFQEAGRAGRDGQPATAYLLATEQAANDLLTHLEESYPERDRIRKVYERLAYFFQIAPGAGFNNMFDFDLYRFCSAYKMSATEVVSALRILTMSGYISYIEDPESHSRLMFTCTKEHLYHLERFDSECQRIISGLLRLYSGMFADFQHFSEDRIAAYAKLEREEVYQKLLLLSRFHVLHYVPARQTPCIYYQMPRLDTDEVRIPHTVYEERKQRDKERADAMLDYAYNNDCCRLQKLLRYFGEKTRIECGKCDVCLGKVDGTHRQAETLEAKAALRALVLSVIRNDGPLTPMMLGKKLEHPELLPEVLREMINQNVIRMKDNRISLAD